MLSAFLGVPVWCLACNTDEIRPIRKHLLQEGSTPKAWSLPVSEFLCPGLEEQGRMTLLFCLTALWEGSQLGLLGPQCLTNFTETDFQCLRSILCSATDLGMPPYEKASWLSWFPGIRGSFEKLYSHTNLFPKLFFPRLLGLLLVPSVVSRPTLLRPKPPRKPPRPWECPEWTGSRSNRPWGSHPRGWHPQPQFFGNEFPTAPRAPATSTGSRGHHRGMWGVVGSNLTPNSTPTMKQQFLSSRFPLAVVSFD